MSRLAEIAAKIPAEYRKEMLELNLIDDAVATEASEAMHYLVVMWQNYVEKDFEPSCPLCLSRVLKNMKAMKKHLIELEKQSNLLKSV